MVTHCNVAFTLLLLIFIFRLTEAAKKEYFERNFAWHAITESKGELSANVENATIMFIRPSPDGKSKDRLGTMKTTYNLKVIDCPMRI
jgi:ionotropic glutamate receptor